MTGHRRLHVLMFTSTLGYGGAEGAFLRLASYLARHFEVKIALMSQDYGDAGYSTVQSQTNLPTILLDEIQTPNQGILTKSIRWARMLMRLRALKSQHDVTISFLSGPNLLNSIAGRPKYTILSERGSKRFNDGMSATQKFVWARLLDPVSYRGAETIVAASEGLASEIRSGNPSIAEKVVTSEGTVQTERLMEMAEASYEPEFRSFLDWPTIVSFGRIHYQKGFDALIRVFADVKRSKPEARLLLIGDGPQSSEYLALAQSLGLRAGTTIEPDKFDVVFAGYRPDPLRYLKLANVFVLTSRYEGLPNALIEALASGIQVMSADCPWGPRSILAGQNVGDSVHQCSLPVELPHGKLMPLLDSPINIQVWVYELIKALKQPRLRRSAATCREAISRFDIEANGPQWKSLIIEHAER